tara:strand:+ start:508 stop:972 length:465 start_codon:yes stop_codon:yes gene_type:complete
MTYLMKRPTQGYETEAERDMCSWSGVSEWEVFHQDKKIGNIYKTTSYTGDWGWSLCYKELGDEKKGYSYTRKDALNEIIYEHEKVIMDKMREDNPHNQIMLQTPDGGRISIVQGYGTMGVKGETVELWDFVDEPVQVDTQELMIYLLRLYSKKT